jgi:hypothetical protein
VHATNRAHGCVLGCLTTTWSRCYQHPHGCGTLRTRPATQVVISRHRYCAHQLPAGDPDISQRLQAALDLLGAFGNAKTILNDDSNRYGLAVRLALDSSGSGISSFDFTAFAFQPTRLQVSMSDQRNFHVFYYLINFLDDDRRAALFLQEPITAYTYLNRTGCLSAAHHHDRGGYDRMCRVGGGRWR